MVWTSNGQMRFVCAAKAKWVMDLLPKINTVIYSSPISPRTHGASQGRVFEQGLHEREDTVAMLVLIREKHTFLSGVGGHREAVQCNAPRRARPILGPDSKDIEETFLSGAQPT